MKGFVIILLLTLASLASSAQFATARLQATGLTCAMCSNAINKALQKLPFVESVKSDIKNSAFDIVFRKESAVNLDKIRKAVEDAGFFVGKLSVTGTLADMPVEKDQHFKIGGENFHLLNARDTVLKGELTFTLMDKYFLTEKEFKKASRDIKAPCLQTGKAAACCIKEGIAEGERVYHVVL